MHKHIAASLAAAVVLTGLVATPAQALTTSSSTPSPTSSSTQTAEPTAAPTASDPTTPSPTATATASPTPAPSPTATSKPSAAPTPAPTQRVAPQSSTTEAPAEIRKPTVATGDLTGGTRSAPKYTWTPIKGKVSTGPEGLSRQYRVEILNPKTKIWSTYLTGWTLGDGTWYNYIEATKDDTQTFRLVVDADDAYDKYAGPATVFTRTKLSMVITNMTNNNLGSTFVSVPWEQKKLDVFISRGVSGVTLELQNLRSGKWVTVSKQATKSGVNSYSFNIPKGSSKSKNTTQGYRVASAATVDYSAGSSVSTNYRWENPYLYTGTQRAAYNYTAKYCPTVMIKMDGNLAKTNRWGQASLGGNQKIFSLYTKIPTKHLKTVALHECSHFYQYDTATNKNNKGWKAYGDAANKLMGTKDSIGMERVNECMSDTWAKHSYWSYGASAKLCAQPKVKDFVQKSLKGQKVT